MYFIGSADLMPRNLDRRVEVIAPIENPEHQERLQEVLDVSLADDVLAWELDADGVWRQGADRSRASTPSGACTSWPSCGRGAGPTRD